CGRWPLDIMRTARRRTATTRRARLRWRRSRKVGGGNGGVKTRAGRAAGSIQNDSGLPQGPAGASGASCACAGYQTGTLSAALENDLALMKGGEFRAMTDADDGRVWELPRQKSHQTILAA